MAPQDVVQLYHNLQKTFYAPACDLQKCGNILNTLKMRLLEAGLLIPDPSFPIDDLVLLREVLEIGAFWSIRSKDVPSFDRYFSQLQIFYTDFRSNLPPSPRQYPVIGLNLTRLLTQNRIADFHTTLEAIQLSPDELFENQYIKHPVSVERWLMEGSYSKLWGARQEAPTEEYRLFVDSLMGTIRDEIASCEEAAYDSLPFKDAALLLFFQSQSELIEFAQKRGWKIDFSTETLRFSTKGEEKVVFPAKKLISASLKYARELEQIV